MSLLKKHENILLVLLLVLIFAGCQNTARRAFDSNESQVQLRSIQTRSFDTTDKKKMMQTVISTMQDLDFVIDKADALLGAVTGSKFIGNKIVVMTVTTRSRGETQLLVRVNARCGIQTVEDPETYQDFFVALGKSLFLAAHQVD